MKKILSMIAAATIISLAANAQKKEVFKVPAAAKASFANRYPGIAAKWEKENGRYEANFKQNGHSMSVLIDEKGTIAETEMEIKVTDLPAAVSAYLKVHYKGKPITEAAKITRADGTVIYEAEVSGKDVIFDAHGKFLEIEKD